MTAGGYPAVVVPLEWWHWIPTLGGRSCRPILERIDYAVDWVLSEGWDKPVPAPSYGLSEWLADLLTNPGGVPVAEGLRDPDHYPVVQPLGADFTEDARRSREPPRPETRRIALVGHSAGGWISRIFLEQRSYGGRAYCGSDRVHTLVTLGSPHAVAPGIAFYSLAWLNRSKSSATQGVRALAVGSKGFLAANSSDFTRNAYILCGADPNDGDIDGDGVTPLYSAHAFDGAEKLTLEGVTHSESYPSVGPTAELCRLRSEGQPWYGSPGPLEQWLGWLRRAFPAQAG